MTPFIYRRGGLIFWFHSYDVLNEDRASVHVGKGSQNDDADAKIWLEPEVEICRYGKSLAPEEVWKAEKAIKKDLKKIREKWDEHRERSRRFGR